MSLASGPGDIYAASESPLPDVSGEALARGVSEAGHPNTFFGGSIDEIALAWPDRFEPGELVLTLGAGSIVTLGPKLIASIEARRGGHS